MIKPRNWREYELIDHGRGRKLERFGPVITDRPEPSATWEPALPASDWDQAHTQFRESGTQKGKWTTELEDWEISYTLGKVPVRFKLNLSAFKHVGLFPEQAANWEYISERCLQLLELGVVPRVLNLFAYTGGASLVANLSGAEVTHVDSSKSVVTWARQNAVLNKIDTIRWIVEDATRFVEKEIRRGNHYHGIIMDPPIHGLGPRGRHWKLTRDLPPLLEQVMQLLDPENRFFVLNTYSPQLTLSGLKEILFSTPGFPNQCKATTLGLQDRSGRPLPLGNLIRF